MANRELNIGSEFPSRGGGISWAVSMGILTWVLNSTMHSKMPPLGYHSLLLGTPHITYLGNRPLNDREGGFRARCLPSPFQTIYLYPRQRSLLDHLHHC